MIIKHTVHFDWLHILGSTQSQLRRKRRLLNARKVDCTTPQMLDLQWKSQTIHSLTIANNGQTENLVTVEKCRIRRQIAGLMVSRTSGSIARVISISARFQMGIFSLVRFDGVWATIS